MALILPGAAVALSGKLGGTVFSRNRYGQYARNRSIPVNPNSSAQQDVRTNFGNLAIRWKDTLTELQRAGWADYANQTTWINRLGVGISLAANAMYMACNGIRLQLGLTVRDDEPPINGLGTLTAPGTIAVDSGGNQIVLAGLTAADSWQAGGKLGVYLGERVNNAVEFYKGPFRLGGTVGGGTATLTGATITITGVTIVSNSKYFVRIAGSSEDGRPLQPLIQGVISV